MDQPRVFVSQPLRALLELDEKTADKYRDFYRQIIDICKNNGYTPYEPQQHTDPKDTAALGANRVYRMNEAALLDSQLVIAYVGLCSNGVGAEVQMARSAKIPVIIIYEKEREQFVSRMMRAELDDNVIMGIINQYSLDEIPEQLQNQFKHFDEMIRKSKQPLPTTEDTVAFLNDIKERRQLSFRDIGRALGKDPGYVSRVFNGKITQPDRDFILALCLNVLKMSLPDTHRTLKGFQHNGFYWLGP